MNPPPILLSGHIRSQSTQKGIPGLRVEAWDKDLRQDDRIGNGMTDAQGAFSILLEPGAGDWDLKSQKPDIYFKIFAGPTQVHSTVESVRWNITESQSGIEILIPMEDLKLSSPNVVEGIVTNLQAQPLSGLVVKAFNRDMRSETLLGEATTDAQGRYRITYPDLEPARTEMARADLSMQVYSASGKEQLFVTDLADVLDGDGGNDEVCAATMPLNTRPSTS